LSARAIWRPSGLCSCGLCRGFKACLRVDHLDGGYYAKGQHHDDRRANGKLDKRLATRHLVKVSF
jgi:hypothetical protein